MSLLIVLGAIFSVIWLGPSVLVGFYASNKGQGFWPFFFISIILSPFIGFLIALVSGGSTSSTEMYIKARGRRCPYCRELIHPEAVKCKHCRTELGVAQQ